MGKEEKRLGIIKPKERLFDPDAKVPNKRKKHASDKRSWEEQRYVCPFCGGFIPAKPQQDKKNWFWSSFLMARVEHCPTCGAFEVKNGCPSCKCNTWYKSETKEYAHGWNYNCGFKGKKKEVK